MAENIPQNRPTISSATLFYMAWRNLVSKKLRSLLTISGIIVGVGSVAFLVSFGLGLQKIVTDNVIGNQSIKSVEVSSPNSKIIKLDAKSVNKIRSFPHVKQLGVQYSFPASIGLKGGGVDSVIYGVDETYQELTSLELTQGRLLNKEDNRAVLVSKTALTAIGITDQKKAIGQSMSILIPLQTAGEGSKEIKDDFKIVGVVDSGTNNEVFVPSGIFDVAGVPTYKSVKVIADTTDNIPALRKQIEASGFQTASPIDTLDQINQLFRFFDFVLGGFGGIGIIVAVLGMFNTLTISLLERTKEIGLMITLGGRRRDMRRLFMLEATLLSLIGVIMGIIFASAGGWIVNTIINHSASSRVGQQFNLFSMPFWLIISLTIFMLIIGVTVAYFPARRAQKINPIDALRRE